MTYNPEIEQQLCQLQQSQTAAEEPTFITDTTESVFSLPLERLDPNILLEHPDSATSIILSLTFFILALASFLKVLVPVMLHNSNKQS